MTPRGAALGQLVPSPPAQGSLSFQKTGFRAGRLRVHRQAAALYQWPQYVPRTRAWPGGPLALRCVLLFARSLCSVGGDRGLPGCKHLHLGRGASSVGCGWQKSPLFSRLRPWRAKRLQSLSSRHRGGLGSIQLSGIFGSCTGRHSVPGCMTCMHTRLCLCISGHKSQPSSGRGGSSPDVAVVAERLGRSPWEPEAHHTWDFPAQSLTPAEALSWPFSWLPRGAVSKGACRKAWGSA